MTYTMIVGNCCFQSREEYLNFRSSSSRRLSFFLTTGGQLKLQLSTENPRKSELNAELNSDPPVMIIVSLHKPGNIIGFRRKRADSNRILSGFQSDSGRTLGASACRRQLGSFFFLALWQKSAGGCAFPWR